MSSIGPRRLVSVAAAALVILAAPGGRGADIEASSGAHLAYSFTDLGVLGGLDSSARAVSEDGAVVGHADTQPSSGSRGYHAFRWLPADGALLDLGAYPGDTNSAAQGIDERGHVVGVSMAEDGRTHAFLWDGSLHDIGDLGAQTAEANAINASGQVVGASGLGTEGRHAFLWTPREPNGIDGTMVDLGMLPGGISSYATDINDRGQVTGFTNDADWMSQVFLWTPGEPNGSTGTMIELPYLPGAQAGVAEAVNRGGAVVGSMDVGTTELAERAFLWTPDEPNGATGTVIDLGTLGGDDAVAFGNSLRTATSSATRGSRRKTARASTMPSCITTVR